MTQGIYCYIDKKTNSIIYVGKDSNIQHDTRNKEHFCKSKYNEQQINRVIQNNPNRYQYKVLKKGNFSQELLNSLEIIYIKRYNPLFNFTKGGDGCMGYKHTKSARKKISNAMLGNKHFEGKHHSEKTKEKIRQSKIGEKNPMKKKENREKVSKSLKKLYSDKTKHPFYGKHHLSSTKEKISKTQSKNHNSSGYYRVYKHKSKTTKQGFIWEYRYTDKDGKRKKICSIDIQKLEERVKNKGFDWVCFKDE